MAIIKKFRIKNFKQEKELLRLKSNENENVETPVLSSLENFKIDKTSEN